MLLPCCLLPCCLPPLQASAAVTGVSLVAALAHQLYYTLPNLGPAVLQPVAASSHSAASIAGSHVLYGVITAAHQLLQVQLLSSQGAMAVGLVNAVRASVVSFVSSWFFCSSMAHLCLSYWRAVGAMVVTAGAALWVVAGERRSAAETTAGCAWCYCETCASAVRNTESQGRTVQTLLYIPRV